jgi:hypothetical protein
MVSILVVSLDIHTPYERMKVKTSLFWSLAYVVIASGYAFFSALAPDFPSNVLS